MAALIASGDNYRGSTKRFLVLTIERHFAEQLFDRHCFSFRRDNYRLGLRQSAAAGSHGGRSVGSVRRHFGGLIGVGRNVGP